MTTLAIGPRTTAASWEWVGLGLAAELGTNFSVAIFDNFAVVPSADIVLVIKQRMPPTFAAAVKARGASLVYAPIDVYFGPAEIAADAEAIAATDLVLLHSEALRPHIAPYCGALAPVEHDARFALAERVDYKPNGYILWLGGCEHVPHLLRWLEDHPLASDLRILTDLNNRRGRIAAQIVARDLGVRLDFGEAAINGHPAFLWSEALQATMMRECRAAIDIKGLSFNQATKPPTKAQQFLASGIPFGCNLESSVATYLNARGFEVCDAADEARLTSREYFDLTRTYAPRLRAATTLEAVGQSVIAAIAALPHSPLAPRLRTAARAG